MTRINVVPPDELCDQHLLAEWREMTRIPNQIISGKYRYDPSRIPSEYTIRTADDPDGGKGHVLFFTDKLQYLYERYHALLEEAKERGLNLNNQWRDYRFPKELWKNYTPTQKAIKLNSQRIKERMPKSPRYYRNPL